MSETDQNFLSSWGASLNLTRPQLKCLVLNTNEVYYSSPKVSASLGGYSRRDLSPLKNWVSRDNLKADKFLPHPQLSASFVEMKCNLCFQIPLPSAMMNSVPLEL